MLETEIIVQEWLFIVFQHCHQIFHIFFYLKSVKNAKIGDFWGYPGPNLAILWKLFPDFWLIFAKNWSKCKDLQFFGDIQFQIWQPCQNLVILVLQKALPECKFGVKTYMYNFWWGQENCGCKYTHCTHKFGALVYDLSYL